MVFQTWNWPTVMLATTWCGWQFEEFWWQADVTDSPMSPNWCQGHISENFRIKGKLGFFRWDFSLPLGFFRTWNLKIRHLVKMWFWNNLIWTATGDNLCTGRTEYIPGRNQIKKGWSNQFCILGHFKQNLRTANLTRARWTSNVFLYRFVQFDEVQSKRPMEY